MTAINPMELFLLSLLGGGLGLPSATPPLPEDALTLRVAPAEVLFFASWAGTAAPDGTSNNRTERLLAEPEVSGFLRNSGGIAAMLQQQMAAGGDQQAIEGLAKVAPLLNILQKKAGSVYLSNLSLQPFHLQGGIIARLDDQAQTVLGTLEELLAQAPDVERSDVQVGSRKFARLQPSDGPPVTYGLAGPYLLIGIGDGELESMMQRARAQAAPWLMELHKRLPVERRSTIGYVNLQKFLPLIPSDPGITNVLSALGVDKIKTLSGVTGMDASGTVNRTLITLDGPPTGMLSWLDMRPLEEEDLQTVPRQSPAAVVLRLDAAEAFDAVVSLANQMQAGTGDQLTQALAGMEGQFGFNLRTDLLGSLGNTWRIYAHPGPNWVMNGWTISIDLRDATKFREVHETLLAKGGEMLTAFGLPGITTAEEDGKVVHSIALGVATPTWTISDDQFVVSMNSLAVNAATSGKTRASLANVTQVKSLMEETPTLHVAHIDMKRALPMLMMAMEMAMQQAGPEVSTDTSTLPPTETISQHLLPSIIALRRTQDGFEIISRQTLPTSNIAAATPIATALILPAIQAARGAARQMQSQNNLQTISLGIYNYSVKYKTLPPAYTADGEGKPLLSWRVHILPFIGHAELYSQFKLGEPWDSPANMALIPQMPDVFVARGSEAGPGKTNFLGVGGADGVFGPPPGALVGVAFADIKDGTSNTMLVVEANDASAVVWTQPGDFDPAAGDAMSRLQGLRPGGFQALFCDGSVKMITPAVDPASLQGAFTKNGMEPVTIP